MSMQDNDIDQLFRAKLGDTEVEPSDKVWKGIAVELNGAKQKSTLLPVIRIAASITVLVAAGLFFMLKDGNTEQFQASNNVKKHPSGLHINASNLKAGAEKTEEPKQEDVKIAATVEDKPEVNTSAIEAGSVRRVAAVQHTTPVIKHQPDEPNPGTKATTDSQPLVVDPQQTVAAVTNSKVEVTQPVVPDQPLNVPVKTSAAEADGFTAGQNKVLTAQLPANKTNKAPSRKHGIRSLGDLINVVVAKVDKRQDKVIEFSDTDDDESTVTGINLGIIKVKREK